MSAAQKLEIRKLASEYKKWKRKKGAGCYPYAMKVPIDKFCLIGDFVGNRCCSEVSNEVLIENLKKEAEEIFQYKIEETTLDSPIKQNQFKVILVRIFHSGYYHFYRQNMDGTFTHKMPGELPLEVNEEEIRKDGCEIWVFLITI